MSGGSQVADYWDDEGNLLCGAKRKQCTDCGFKYTADHTSLTECPECEYDRRCRRPAGWGTYHSGEGRCKLHAGLTPRGAESAAYKHGKFSKYLPSDLRAAYEDFLDDPRRLSLEREMAFVRALIADRAMALREVNSAEAWGILKKKYEEMMFAQRQQQNERFARLLLELGDVVEKGASLASTRKEVKDLIEQERKLVDTQRQLYVDMGEFITRGMALTMFGSFLEAVKNHVLPLEGGAKALSAIATTVRAMAGALGGRSPGERGDEANESDLGVAE